MRTRRRGGGKLGEGKSAKVIYPAIPCSDGRDLTNYVSRVPGKRTRKNPLVDLVSQNLRLMETLKAVDPTQKYLFYPETCEPGELTSENKEDGVTEESKHLSELYMRGGITWEDYCKIKTPTKKQLNHLLQGMKKLHNAKIVHGDFKADNIVMGNDNLPRIIDFGNSIYDSPQELIDMEEKLFHKRSPLFRQRFLSKMTMKLRKAKYPIMIEQRGN
jgi:hypothetical protein